MKWWGNLVGGSDDSLLLVDYFEKLPKTTISLDEIYRNLGLDTIFQNGQLKQGAAMGFDMPINGSLVHAEMDIASGAVIDLAAIVLESLHSGFVDLQDLDHARSEKRITIQATKQDVALLCRELETFAADPLAYDLAKFVPEEDMLELGQAAQEIANELDKIL
ncbi:MAG: imm68 putative immunity domain-containing protein [Candidatus Pristimantibacillus sp.]